MLEEFKQVEQKLIKEKRGTYIIFKRTRRKEINNMNEKISEFIEYSNKGILSKDIVKNNKLNVTLFCMAKGTEISEHTSTKEGFVYVIEGDGTFKLEGKDIMMLSGTFIYMKGNAIHSLKANENTSFILVLTNA